MLSIDLTQDQYLYLHRILDSLHQNNRWPTYRELDQWFTRSYPDLDIEQIWKSLPPSLTNFMDLNQPDSQATLTFPAFYLLEKNAPFFDVFLQAIKLCVEAYVDAEQPEISSETILRLNPFLPSWWEQVVHQVGLLLKEEPNIWLQFGWTEQSGHWKCTPAREVRRFRGITTIEDYLEKRDLPRKQVQGSVRVSALDIPIVLSAQSIQIHPDIHAKCWGLYQQGNYDDAIFNATKALEVAVRTKANLPDTSIGKDVINTAFSLKNPLLRYHAIDAEQEGMMSLLRGIIQVYKNPQSHRHVGVQSQVECLGLLLMCSNLLFVIDTLQVEDQGNTEKGEEMR